MAIIRPTSTITSNEWRTQSSGTDLHTALDESSFSDADYIQSAASPPTAFPSLVTVTDNFNRADETPATGWTGITGVSAMRVVSNGLTGQATWSSSYYNTSYSVPFEMNVKAVSDFAAGQVQEINYLTTDAGSISPIRDGFRRGYRIYTNLPSTGDLSIYETDGAGGFSPLVSFPWTFANNDSFGVRVSSLGVHKLYAKASAGAWTLLGSVTDTTYTSGYTILATDGNGIAVWDDLYAGTPIGDIAEVKFGAGTDPGIDTGHIIRYRYKKDTTGGDQINLSVKLLQGSTVIKTWNHTNIDAVTTATQTLLSGEAATITDYTDLRLRFEAITG